MKKLILVVAFLFFGSTVQAALIEAMEVQVIGNSPERHGNYAGLAVNNKSHMPQLELINKSVSIFFQIACSLANVAKPTAISFF